MRTFTEYISEARQNYIFGGTDDRNTATTKTFGELVPGDTIYLSGKNVVIAVTFVRLKRGSIDTLFYTYKDTAGQQYPIALDKHSYADLDSSNIAIVDKISKWIVSTDDETIIEETNKRFNTNLTVNDIVNKETDKIDN